MGHAARSASSKPGSRTQVTIFVASAHYRFFWRIRMTMPSMLRAPKPPAFLARNRRCKLVLIGLVLLIVPGILLADSSGRLRGVATPGCYCHCAGAHTAGGCAKMCELPRYASRWWAKTCARPHAHPRGEDPGAGPHLHHSNHAEYARK
jgi:hypothetical protein